MFLMSTLVVLCGTSIHFYGSRFQKKIHPCGAMMSPPLAVFAYEKWRKRRRQVLGLVPNAKRTGNSRKRPWWQRLFSDEDGETWLSMDEDDLLEDDHELDGEPGENENLEEKKFEAWRRRAEAISELQDAQEDARNAENRGWEDWLGESYPSKDSSSSWDQDGDERERESAEDPDDLDEKFPERRLVQSIQNLVLRNDDELLFEDRVFKYASTNSAKFLVLLLVIPWALDFLAHDYVLMPFLERYVKTVPLAAEFLDVRKDQKLEMIKALKVEKARFRFEVEIGKAPPLSDDEVWIELRHKAIELRDEWRLENRKAFANIWSDMVYGITLFLLIYFNQSKVALLKFTGYKLLNNVSDTGKAFLIILVTDIFLGYHSESGWQALIEAILERYNLEVDQAAITIFVCFVPVVIDACVKLWLFKFLPRLSPNVANIFQEMKRH